jgi:hypothetical protein
MWYEKNMLSEDSMPNVSLNSNEGDISKDDPLVLDEEEDSNMSPLNS